VKKYALQNATVELIV